MPICSRAARTRYAPSSGESCTSLPTSSISRVPLRDIFEALVAEQGPSFEHFIHPVARRLQVGADRRIGPSLRVQIDTSAAALVRIGESPQRVDSASWSR